MSFSHRCLFIAAAVPALLACPSAFAGDPAAAQGLFNDAKKLMAEERWADACPKLEESQRLDPGIGTLFNLANCHEHIGRSATAWAEFLEVAFAAKSKEQTAREKAARDRASALEPKLTRLTITVSAPTPDLTVTRDGESVGRAQWGVALPVDPGPHKLVATAPGKHRFEASVRIAPDAKYTVFTVPVLPDEMPQPPPPLVTVAPPPIAAPPPATPPHGAGRTQRLVGIAVAGAGVVAVAIGAGFGLSSKGKHDDAQSHCDASNHCDAAGLSLRDDAIQSGTISTVAFGLGAAAIATGAVLFFIAPRESARSGQIQASPLIGQNASGISVRGAW
ncbi:MAG: hypothetical protein ABIP89_08695 [Polyangiaceae bacterium]